jgi:hypothetical protein
VVNAWRYFLFFVVLAPVPPQPFAADLQQAKEFGKSVALAVKEELGKNLMQAIGRSKFEGAVKFCNEQAYSLTAQKAQAFGARVKRATDRPRNPKNQADAEELKYLRLFKTQMPQAKPELIESHGEYHFYAPIVTNAMCLKCHGNTKKDIAPEVLATLKRLYPKDQATGYKEGQVRGIFSIHWKKKK